MGDVRYNGRFPDGLLARLTVIAKAAGRTRNAEIVDRLARDYTAGSSEVELTPHRGDGQTIIRMPEALWEDIVLAAKRNGRSANTEIVFRVLCSLYGAERKALSVPVNEVRRSGAAPRIEGTLRDWFAGHALSGLCAFPEKADFAEIAKEAYQAADAMLAERSK